ncbi:transporter substrate-binding domain-containing protein [Halovulum dunhuangense]|uniref:Transporter substrate-binding domain-containing protein n=1 Tax=Halovulum dunhuangense TaxID=1505036 RepID=A0A849L132_9RHOB|nr:transporter substrate-binding domain-containing protein [Halovulum dunhuangense]NNU79929.1 transporter substrate-binding domain-containing protein [Halovulum dunhuangense]
MRAKSMLGAAGSKRALRSGMTCLAALMALAAGPAPAQLIGEVDQAELKNWRIAEGNVIRFCQFDVNLTNDFDKAVAGEIADRLLLDSEFITVGADYGMDGDGLEADVFKLLWNECEVVLGFQVGPVQYAPEFTVTRPWVSYDYMVLASADGPASIADLPSGSRIATPLASPGDLALARWMATEGADAGLKRIPFARARDQMDAVLTDQTEAMLIFSPVFAVLAQDMAEQAARLHPVAIDPAIASPTSIGGIMLAGSAFLRAEIDRAIDSMIEDGTIEDLLDLHGFSGIPARAGGA